MTWSAAPCVAWRVEGDPASMPAWPPGSTLALVDTNRCEHKPGLGWTVLLRIFIICLELVACFSVIGNEGSAQACCPGGAASPRLWASSASKHRQLPAVQVIQACRQSRSRGRAPLAVDPTFSCGFAQNCGVTGPQGCSCHPSQRRSGSMAGLDTPVDTACPGLGEVALQSHCACMPGSIIYARLASRPAVAALSMPELKKKIICVPPCTAIGRCT